MNSTTALNSALYSGWIRHRRFSPRQHEFRYRIGLLYLDLAEQDAVFELSALASRSRFAPFSFSETDYQKTITRSDAIMAKATAKKFRATYKFNKLPSLSNLPINTCFGLFTKSLSTS